VRGPFCFDPHVTSAVDPELPVALYESGRSRTPLSG
jgi:hypothetical protein